MVAGRNALLLVGVLSGFGADTGLSSKLPESVEVVKSISVDVLSSSIPSTPASGSGEEVAGVQSATGTVEGASGVVDSGKEEAVSSTIKPSFSAVGLKATPAAAISSTDGEEYIYPGLFGAGGTLTTDSKAPTRSVAPSKNSVSPNNPGSVRGPPPGEATPRPGAIAPPAAPPVDETPAAPVRTRPGAVRPTNALTKTIEATTDLGWVYTSTATPWRNTTVSWDFQTKNGSTRYPTPTISYCQPSDYVNSVTAITTWSVVYTSTVTWTGNPKDYKPPFPPIVTPPPDKLRECIEPLPPPRLTLSVCTSTGTGTKYSTCYDTTSTDWNFGPVMSTHTAIPTATVVFLTTDKNPAVVFSPIKTPDYGLTTQPRTKEPQKATPTKNAPPPYNDQKTQTKQPAQTAQPAQPAQPGQPGGQPGGQPPPQQQQQSTLIRKPVTVVVRPSAVIIDGNTISDRPPVSTQVVVIDGRTFTIEPTRVVGEDATITRPQSTNGGGGGGGGGGVFVPAPTSTTLGGVPVVISSNVAIVDGTQYTIGPVATTANLANGKPVVIGTGGVVVAGDTLAVPTVPRPTEVVVAGGELITAIGKSVVVIFGTTITYGVSGAVSTTQIGDDTIVLGPSGITAAPGTTLGGDSAKAGETAYALVGGVTITEIGESVLVINEGTFTVGPGSPTVTTEVSGEQVTIGPSGVTIDKQTFAYPFGAASTTVIPAVLRPVPSAVTASPTGYGYTGPGSSSDGGGAANPQKSKDAAPGGLVPGLRMESGGGGGIWSLVCIAIGVVVFGI
ncbi:hypothetical protein V8F20_005464 [Naviculisporaceae sp. PSN 640]